MKRLVLAMVIMNITTTLCFADDVSMSISKIKNKETRQEGIKELEATGPAVLPQLQDVAKDKSRSQDERIAAIILLGKIGRNAAKEEEVQKGSQKLPGMAKKSVSRKQVRVQLEGALKNDNDKFTREASALALGNLNDQEAIPKLKEALTDESGNVRMRAALGLAKLGDSQGKEPALQALKQQDVTAQLLAIDVLEEYNDKSVIPRLQQNLSSDNVWTRIHSMLAIKKIEIKELQGQARLNYLQETLKGKQFEVNNWAAEELAKEITNNTENRKQSINILTATAKNSEIAGNYSSNKMLRHLLNTGKITESELQ